MKKRILFVCVVLLSCTVVFGATNLSNKVSSLTTAGSTVSQRVVWNYSAEDIFEVGFSTKEVTSADQSVGDTAEDFELVDNPNNTTESVSGYGEIYVYWKIKSYAPLNITLKNEKAMNNGTDDLNWRATWNKKDNLGSTLASVSSGTIEDGEGSYGTECAVYSQDKRDESENKLVIGSTKVTMETANAAEKTEGAYYGTLTLKIATPQ